MKNKHMFCTLLESRLKSEKIYTNCPIFNIPNLLSISYEIILIWHNYAIQLEHSFFLKNLICTAILFRFLSSIAQSISNILVHIFIFIYFSFTFIMFNPFFKSLIKWILFIVQILFFFFFGGTFIVQVLKPRP